jgi:hypothetical protein
MFALLLTGCQTNSIETIQEEGKQMSQEEEKQLKEKAIKYIKEKYNKDFEVSEVSKGQAAGLIRVRGVVKDGKDTEATVFWEKPDEMDDTYVTRLWTEELKSKNYIGDS